METKGFMGKIPFPPPKALKSTQLITARDATPNVFGGLLPGKMG